MTDAAVQPDAEGHVVVVLENHKAEPVVVEEGQVLGHLHEATLCVTCQKEELVSAVTEDDFTQERVQRLRSSLQYGESCLSEEEKKQLEEMALDYADAFALDSSELGSTDVVTHTINTGDHPPVKQPARRVNLQPFLYPSVISFERSGGCQQLSSRP